MRELESFVWRDTHSEEFLLRDLATSLTKFSASEPRDRVFAAVQLYLKYNYIFQVPSLLVTDYSKSVADVYRDATRFILRCEGPAAMRKLRLAHHRFSEDLEVKRTGFTSWTIRFDRTFDSVHDAVECGIESNAGYKKDTACQDWETEFLDDTDANLLVSKAVLIDTVTITTESFDADEDNQAKCILETLQGWAKQTAIAEVLTCSRLKWDDFQFNDPSERLDSYQSFYRYVSTWNCLPPSTWTLCKSSTREESIVVWFGRCFGRSVNNRRLFLTRDGRVGCGPKLMKAGDVVFVMKGAQTACILRPVEGKDYWLFVGEAYVHGIMHGEIFDQEEINWEWVKLR